MLVKKILHKIFVFLVILLIFYFKGLIFLDPDFGWRIKAGEYYWNNGFPETDIFTYTMPNFPWVDHAWGTSLIFYLVNNYLGYPTLVFLMSLLLSVTIWFLSKGVLEFDFSKAVYDKLVFVIYSKYFSNFLLKLNIRHFFPFSFFPFILATSIFLPFFGVRAQVVSWFMFSVLIYWVFNEKVFKRTKIFLPAFFLIWSNLHGSFALGILTLFLYLGLRSIKARKIISMDNFIGLFSLLTTFINPYGWGIWREAWSSASDAKLRWNIAEWMPALTMFDLAMIFLMSLSLVFVWKYRKKFTLFELIIYLFLFMQAISSKRQLPLWTIIALPITEKGLFYFWIDIEKVKKGKDRFIGVYKIAWIMSLFIFLIQAVLSFNDSYAVSLEKFYPVSAVKYLQLDLPEGEILSDYGWGGYLIMNLPHKKVFVDGRMPSWRWDSNSVDDLPSAFDTYNEMLKGEADYREVFEKFDIYTILVKKQKEVSGGTFLKRAENFLNLFGWEKNDFDFIETIENDGWTIIYEDDVAVIYTKN